MDNPKILKHTTAHHHRQWLDAVYDLPQKAKGVEIYNCFEYETMRLHWNGCGLILHELCHLIHQLVLKDGLENQMVLNAFGCAIESGLYDEVLRRDWAFLVGEDDEEEESVDAAYATINHKEFFSEISVAFLSRGYDFGFWNWTRNKRRKVVEGGGGSGGDDVDARVAFHQDMWLCSPPFMSPEVLARKEAFMRSAAHRPGYHTHDYEHIKDKHNKDWMNNGPSFLINILQRLRGERGGGHCNKFFPFTREQLKVHDPATFAVFQQLWHEIEQWKDPIASASLMEKNDECSIFTCLTRMNSCLSTMVSSSSKKTKHKNGCRAIMGMPDGWLNRCSKFMILDDAFQNHDIALQKKSNKDILNTAVEDGEQEDEDEDGTSHTKDSGSTIYDLDECMRI
eukprot:CAMPEP_0176487302 /NCGR_PEP_ID=MMETSP0200_2-20121128/6051_1 /TAXON_ID=947934 /ORGANISM="Chaetoceros sp., Strain GSL56" /LENGTH=395 /DNA_ID=CAMNT_0017884105 /DNA_START=611 /DNA_END=1798 /DNA_ORIENTATION=-